MPNSCFNRTCVHLNTQQRLRHQVTEMCNEHPSHPNHSTCHMQKTHTERGKEAVEYHRVKTSSTTQSVKHLPKKEKPFLPGLLHSPDICTALTTQLHIQLENKTRLVQTLVQDSTLLWYDILYEIKCSTVIEVLLLSCIPLPISTWLSIKYKHHYHICAHPK